MERKIKIVDKLPPETVAMLQALYSRSPKSVDEHLKKITDDGAAAFMGTHYVGYGHKSIGDCGTTTIFIEGVSMLAAKAIQDSPLYNGQECSTRYMDMENNEFKNPFGTEEGAAIQEGWREIYKFLLPRLRESLAARHPRENETERVWKNAINARAFDIARGWLPAGATTNLSWHTTLSLAAEHLIDLETHPLEEVRQIGAELRESLKEKYPSSFGRVINEDVLEFHKSAHNPYEGDFTFEGNGSRFFTVDTSLFSDRQARHNNRLWKNKPKRAMLPKNTDIFGKLVFEFPLDFASYRDLQRHRSCLQPVPELRDPFFSQWYTKQVRDLLSFEDYCAFIELFDEQTYNRMTKEFTGHEGQYYMAMGYEVDCTLVANLRSAVYIAGLRSGQSVHPTLRVVAQKMAKWLDNWAGYPICGADYSKDKWNSKRGEQTIEEKV